MADLNRFESLVERRLREASERGEFDELAGAGRPVKGLDQPYDPAWWAKGLIERERLADATRAELAEIDRQLARIWPLRSISEVRERVAQLNERLEPHHAHPLDSEEVVGMWRRFGIYRRSE